MGRATESEKAARYISLLDEARCAGRWADVPELCRKVDKHAPHRRCLTFTARCETQIATYRQQRPSTAASSASSAVPATLNLSQLIPSLLEVVETEHDHAQDAFQATVCLGWLHYVLDEPGLAVARLPSDFGAIAAKLSGEDGPLSGWTRVSIVKGVFLKGSSYDRTGAVEDAIQTFSSILPWLASIPAMASESSLFKMWTERLLVRLCQLCDQSTESGEYVEPSAALQAFRFWAKFWDSTGGGSGAEGMAQHRRSAWKAYYSTLAMMLQRDFPYEPATRGTAEKSGARLLQRAELKRAESTYESLLLKDTPFPKASGNNREIEDWADSVMANWRVLCGQSWSDEDLGEGGKEAVSRGVLDILYRAATKTFHSTLVLRHLFAIHASLSEFDLAYRAYDSYVEIVNRGKDRAEKSGEEDAGIDDDSTILRTSAEAIRMLCRYGSRKEAEKALQIGDHIEQWLEQISHIKLITSGAESAAHTGPAIEPRALAQAYCAIGVSQAQWARYTYEADTRASIQARAAQYLRKSLEPGYEDSNNIEALYALGLVLSEMRDIPGAIKVVKRALLPPSKQQNTESGLSTEYGQERKLIPLWHLLALLLTSRSEFSAAEKACEAAFEQFGDVAVLFGDEEEKGGYRSEHLNAAASTAKPMGIVDQMESFEKTGILQVKMTQLALVEVLEGPSAAVDGCDELLALFTRLFGEEQTVDQTKLQAPTVAPPAAPVPPKSAHGTIRGSIFRSKGSVKVPIEKETRPRNPSISTVATQATVAPAIQVTDENGAEPTKSHNHHHHHHLFHHSHKHEEEKTGVTRSPSKLQKRSANSLHRKSVQDAGQVPDVPALEQPGDGATNETAVPAAAVENKTSRRPSMSSSLRKSMESQNRPRSNSQAGPHSREPSSINMAQPPKQTERLPVPAPSASYIPPEPQFSIIQMHRHKVSLLVDIWLFIAGLYTRAGMYEDARGAVAEALKPVHAFEAEVALETSSTKAFADRGSGGGRSVEELWSDVYAARAQLCAAEGLKHEAKADFERALLHYPDHPSAIVGLSNILLDIYTQVIPPEPNHDVEPLEPMSPPIVPHISEPPNPPTHSHSHSHSYSQSQSHKKQHLASHTPSAENNISPPELNRLAARDRAFGLLSTLTKLGAGWDFSEAWFALARSYEESGQVEKTKEVLWWCVELEDTRPVRAWGSVGLGGFVL